jgi:four helix bundle protein
MKDYTDLEIYQTGMILFFKVHPASLLLPKYELYELGSQIRRSADSVVSNIVEGYGRKRYKAEFIRFLVFSHGSCLEVKNHLKKIDILYPGTIPEIDTYINEYDILGAKIYSFINYVEKNWKTNQ